MNGAVYDKIKYVVILGLVLFDAVMRRVFPRMPAKRKVWDGAVKPGSRAMLCVFAHFDRHGMIDDYVVHYLSELSRVGCEIVFVSSAPALREEVVKSVLPHCSRMIWRENVGYDFGSWRDALASCGDVSHYDRIVIANDSVYGPLRDLGEVFRTMEARGAPVWGITDSLRYGRHLQSYFMAFERPVVESELFQGFWRDLPDYRYKHVVILQCEVGLSRRLARAGFRLDALCDFGTITASLRGAAAGKGSGLRMAGVPVNATHWGWRTLIEDYGCPFVKVQLLRDNPKRIADVGRWEPVICAVTEYDTGLIRRHLNRMRRQRN